MKLKAQLGENEYHVSVERRSNAVVAEIADRRYQLEVRELSPDAYLLIHDKGVYRCRVESQRDSRSQFQVTVRGHASEITIIDPKRLRSGQSAGGHGHGAAEIISPMPGKVVRVLVQKGQHVEAGDGIIVVEAMKMQNEMKSPKAGVVVAINAEVGATVNAEDVLAVVE